MHVPLCSAEFVLEVLPPLDRHAFGQAQFGFFDCGVNIREELTAKHGHDRAHGKKIALLGSANPLSVEKAAFGNQAMDVRMQNERLAPGVQGSDDAGLASEMPIVQEKLEQRVPHGCEQDISHLSDVVKPQVAQIMRWRKNHVIMTALHQSIGLSIEPLIQTEPVALRACAMPAGVVPLPVIMFVGT